MAARTHGLDGLVVLRGVAFVVVVLVPPTIADVATVSARDSRRVWKQTDLDEVVHAPPRLQAVVVARADKPPPTDTRLRRIPRPTAQVLLLPAERCQPVASTAIAVERATRMPPFACRAPLFTAFYSLAVHRDGDSDPRRSRLRVPVVAPLDLAHCPPCCSCSARQAAVSEENSSHNARDS